MQDDVENLNNNLNKILNKYEKDPNNYIDKEACKKVMFFNYYDLSVKTTMLIASLKGVFNNKQFNDSIRKNNDVQCALKMKTLLENAYSVIDVIKEFRANADKYLLDNLDDPAYENNYKIPEITENFFMNSYKSIENDFLKCDNFEETQKTLAETGKKYINSTETLISKNKEYEELSFKTWFRRDPNKDLYNSYTENINNFINNNYYAFISLTNEKLKEYSDLEKKNEKEQTLNEKTNLNENENLDDNNTNKNMESINATEPNNRDNDNLDPNSDEQRKENIESKNTTNPNNDDNNNLDPDIEKHENRKGGPALTI